MEEQTYPRDYRKKKNEATIANTQNSTKNVRRESVTTIKTLLSKAILNLDGLNFPPKRQMLAECEFIFTLKTDRTLKWKVKKYSKQMGPGRKQVSLPQ